MLKEIARAKVNLTLRVLGKRSDGYHELSSLVAFADVGDLVSFEPGIEPSVETTGPFASEICGPNLALTALHKLAEVGPSLQLGRLVIEKRLPVAAGIGGGSADAAAVLRAVRRANPALAGHVPWHELAKQLGADVPVCFHSVTATMCGIGDILDPLPAATPVAAVLVNPRVAVPSSKTADVFRVLSAPALAAAVVAHEPAIAAKAGRSLLEAVCEGSNDLTDAACRVMPAVAEVLTALQDAPGTLAARLSGAGPTCFGVYATSDEARTAAEHVLRARPAWWIAPVVIG
jgi:4-diphosphocytidyl-2-C-methyl-D-erythritol kinase